MTVMGVAKGLFRTVVLLFALFGVVCATFIVWGRYAEHQFQQRIHDEEKSFGR